MQVDARARTFLADGAIAGPHLRMTLGADGVSAAAADDPWIGTSNAIAADTEVTSVTLIAKEGTITLVASEAIAVGEYVYGAAAGKVAAAATVPVVTSEQIGVAVTAAAADGDYLEVAFSLTSA